MAIRMKQPIRFQLLGEDGSVKDVLFLNETKGTIWAICDILKRLQPLP